MHFNIISRHKKHASVFDSYLYLWFLYWFFKRLFPTSPLKLVYTINRQPARGYHYSKTNACGESAASKNGGGYHYSIQMLAACRLQAKKAFEVAISNKSEFSIQTMYSCSVHVKNSIYSIYSR